MTKFRKKPIVVEATRWLKNGDHPLDDTEELKNSEDWIFLSEGKVVRYYRRPELDGQRECEQCHSIMRNHGWIDTLEGGHIVCPGDWIITGVAGEMYPCKDQIFRDTYDAASEEAAEHVFELQVVGHDDSIFSEDKAFLELAEKIATLGEADIGFATRNNGVFLDVWRDDCETEQEAIKKTATELKTIGLTATCWRSRWKHL